jgi:integrase/recombinase XerD
VYLRAVEDFARYFKRSPDQLGPDHIRQYQAHLFREKKAIAEQRYPAARRIMVLLYQDAEAIVERGTNAIPKKVLRLSSILSLEEVTSMIESARTPFQRALLMALYATGLRRAELANLKITDIDSPRNVIHVQGGKGRKDGCFDESS